MSGLDLRVVARGRLVPRAPQRLLGFQRQLVQVHIVFSAARGRDARVVVLLAGTEGDRRAAARGAGGFLQPQPHPARHRERHDGARWIPPLHVLQCLPGSPALLRQLGSKALGAPAHPRELALHLEHHANAGQVHPLLLREPLDHPEAGNVPGRVAPAVPGRPLRLHQALALVDPECLRVHAGQLGRHADHVDRAVVDVTLRLVITFGVPLFDARVAHRHGSIPNRARGDSPPASRRLSSSSFSLLLSLEGTSTSTVTSRSPWPPLGFGAPLPRSRNVLPDGVPAGTFSVTAPLVVGTFTPAPRAASANVTGTVSVRSDPFRPNSRCGATRTTTNRSPGRPPGGPGSPRPARRIRAPSRTPAGI